MRALNTMALSLYHGKHQHTCRHAETKTSKHRATSEQRCTHKHFGNHRAQLDYSTQRPTTSRQVLSLMATKLNKYNSTNYHQQLSSMYCLTHVQSFDMVCQIYELTSHYLSQYKYHYYQKQLTKKYTSNKIIMLTHSPQTVFIDLYTANIRHKSNRHKLRWI